MNQRSHFEEVFLFTTVGYCVEGPTCCRHADAEVRMYKAAEANQIELYDNFQKRTAGKDGTGLAPNECGLI